MRLPVYHVQDAKLRPVHHLAFYFVEEPKHGQPVPPECFELLGGVKAKKDMVLRCGTCHDPIIPTQDANSGLYFAISCTPPSRRTP
jgi:hypothetical protein